MQDELLRFGPFELDPAAGELRRSGVIVLLPHQPFRILLLLVQHPGRVVSRDEIHAAIWGREKYVDFEHGINSAVRRIRLALGDQAEVPRYVRTLPRRGYSFIAAVEHLPRPAEIPTPPQRTRISPGMIATAAIAILGVLTTAVLLRRRPRSG